MVTVACVLRSGGIYTPDYVWALHRGLNRHLPEYEFRVLSDMLAPTPWISRLEYGWARWWSKLELFRPGLFEGPVLYLDLDTLVVGDLSAIAAYDGPLALLSDFYRPQLRQSGVMAWTPGPVTEAIWMQFKKDPSYAMRAFHGDGQFIHAMTAETTDRLQDLFPEQIVSYKVAAQIGPPENARLVCFHGSPKPHELLNTWAHHEWANLERPARGLARDRD